jgi:hypothetical protein
MYIPSKFLHEILCSEKVGVFCESNKQGNKAIIAKLPAATIKALALGAKVDFYVLTTSKKPHYLALCLKIFDNESSPMIAMLPQRWQNSNNILDFSFFDSQLDLVLFDETDAPVQANKIKIKTNFRNKRVKNVLQHTDFTSSNDYDSVNDFMSSVFADLGFDYDAHPHYPIVSFKFSVEITEIHSITAIHANEQGSTHYDLTQDIDGTRQERQIYQSLCLIGNSKTAISPLVRIGKKERELTDILTITQNQQLVAIESKCLQVDKDTVKKSYERTTARIIKHCKKALGQLEGVYKTIKRGEIIYDENNNTLFLGNEYSFYGIVLIDEFRPSKDWCEIINLMQELSNKHNVCLNIISLSELIYDIKRCTSNMNLFLESLESRYQTCIDLNTIDIQLTNYSLPTMVE